MKKRPIGKAADALLRLVFGAAMLLAAAPGFALPSSSAGAENDSRPEVTVGLVDTFSPDFYIGTYAPTLDHLIASLPQYRFRVVEIDYRKIREDIAEHRPAFLVTSASDFVSLIETTGAHQVATKLPKSSDDVAHTVASAFIVKSGSPIRTLEDARGGRAAVTEETSFDGWIIAQGEIASRGADPSKFFSRLTQTGYAIPGVVQYVKTGEADVGILAACEYETLLATGQIMPGEFRVLEEKSDGRGCRRSTAQYPDVVFSSLPGVSSGVTRDVTVALLTMPDTGLSFRWTIANDFLPTYGLLKTLSLGPYKKEPWTFHSVWKAWHTEILLILGLIAASVFYMVSINLLVRKRTAQLTESLAQTEHYYREAQASRAKLAGLERANIVSQLSGMFAHEIKQPIMNISFYAGALRLLLKKEGTLSEKADAIISKLSDEVGRSSEIVEHVRGYAKKRESKRIPCDLCAAARGAAAALPPGAPVSVSAPGALTVTADPFELQFIIVNFLRNAVSACEREKNPQVGLLVAEEEGLIRLTVEDNGPALSEEAFASLGKVGRSTKADGLGFGLAIAVTLAESMGGHIEFRQRPAQGLAVSLILRKAGDEK